MAYVQYAAGLEPVEAYSGIEAVNHVIAPESAPEVVRHSASPGEYPIAVDSSGRKIPASNALFNSWSNLIRKGRWILIVVLIVVLGAAVGGGVAGGLFTARKQENHAARYAKAGSIRSSNTTLTAFSPAVQRSYHLPPVPLHLVKSL
jgi:hypothetical protein